MNIIYSIAFLLLFQFLFLFDQAINFTRSFIPSASCQEQKVVKTDVAGIVFKSDDGGQTWRDISEGLPNPLKDDYGVHRDMSFANENGLYLTAGNGIYHNKPTATAPFWKKGAFPDPNSSITPGTTGLFAYNYWGGQVLHNISGTNAWKPVYTNFSGKRVRTVFETGAGTIFIGTDNGLFKSVNRGESWRQVHTGGWVMKLVELNGVMVATSMSGIIRSIDGGENWDLVINEGGVGIAVERIEGGFAAITFSTASNTRRVRTSYDGGKTWQAIDAGLPAHLSIASIIQIGDNFFCGHPAGIFRSSDKGKSWKLLLPSIAGKVFNLSAAGNVIYAIPKTGGC